MSRSILYATRAVLVAGIVTILAACTTTPETKIQRPLSIVPPAKPAQVENNGAIFQPKQGVALFEDRRARQVGDILMVNLVERTSVNRKSETTDERGAEASIDIPRPTLLGRNSTIGASSWEPSSSSKLSFKDNETNSNTISGSISVTVVDILPNGNLAVAGEKQLTVNSDTEYIRLAGVVNPAHISASNTINSTQIADVQFESKNAQGLDNSHYAGMVARFFLTLLPF